ncbi:methyl-accepting chemotaxis protein [Bacillus ndiopicus]|uniref:methyl-accepting chemotaxis protein n=1 Tax=Bacillus ndiopicus TaxID=1347368 RepID=UPI0005AA349F|nr:methyl-accepting chemotaxis protein [Bacillus ndiopicus]
MNEKLKTIVDAIEFYHTTYSEDACVIVTDTEKIIAYKEGKKIRLPIKIGDNVENYKGTTSIKALYSGQYLREEHGPELFGFAYIATAQPIVDKGQVIGVISAVISNEKIDSIRTLATDLSSTVGDMTTTNDSLIQASDDVAERLVDLSELSETMNEDIQQINTIVSFVKDIAVKSRILGLNASIEAARSGEHGRGFAVVASEIQKMAQNSTESAEKIAQQLEKIKASIDSVNLSTNQIVAFTEQLSSSMDGFEDAYNGINNTANKLLDISRY